MSIQQCKNSIQRLFVVSGLAAMTICPLVAPANAQAGIKHNVVKHQLHTAAKLDHKAAVAAAHGHMKAAHKMEKKAATLRKAAHHGM